MPDPNKFVKLNEVGYTLPECCLVCQWREGFIKSLWGYCTLHTYKHGKHTEIHSLGILAVGKCDRFQRDEAAVAREFQSYAEFMKKCPPDESCTVKKPGKNS